MIKPISEYIHYRITQKLKLYNIHSVLDIGGTGKMKEREFITTDANIRYGIDGKKLPYPDNSFDATVSIATLEHTGNIENMKKFLNEAYRVAKQTSIHWFPFGKLGQKVENFKKKIGHHHPCIVPDYSIIDHLDNSNLNYSIEPFMRIDEHLLLLATMYPKLNKPELYDFIFRNRGHMGIILEIKKC
jgi:SAM-dependent methyltransferase